ncbi:MAG TPA: DinB family protein [Caldilineaceae bacterium]|nr:DinB family protein [Caldilineaceae bacterium]
MSLVGTIMRTVFTVQTFNKSLADLIQSARAGGQSIDSHLQGKPDNAHNRQQMRHVIGIERWGQRRLQTVLGEPAIHDEYNGYQPDEELDLATLRQEFAATRAKTLEIVHAIQQKGLADSATANHNDMGDVSLKLWVRYLTMHANFESKRVK